MPQATVQDGYVEYMQVLLPLLRMLFNRKRDLIKQITCVFRSHPDADWVLQFPGTSGPLTPARLLAWIGDDRRRFPTAESLQAVAGTVPITRRSGKRTSVHFRRNCSHQLRSTVDDFARQSLRHSGWAGAYFQEQLARGHKTNRAYRGLANRWMKIYWTLWQNGDFYCEETHIANRSRQGKQIELAEAI
jgi:hypothetical protein